MIDPIQVVDEDGLTVDGLRYFLLKQGVPQDDASKCQIYTFSEDSLP